MYFAIHYLVSCVLVASIILIVRNFIDLKAHNEGTREMLRFAGIPK